MSKKIKDFINELAAEYDDSWSTEKAEDWSKKAYDRISDFTEKRPTRSDSDPDQVQVKQRMLTQLRKTIYENISPQRWTKVKETRVGDKDFKKIDPLHILRSTLSKQYNEILNTKLNHKLENDKVKKFNLRDTMETAFRVLNEGHTSGNSWYDVLSVLALTTGRRGNELYSSKYERRSNYEITWSQLSKSNSTKKNQKYDCPTLFLSDAIITRLDQVRSKFPLKTSFNSLNAKLNDSAKRLFQVEKFHDLRGIYAQIADTLFNNEIVSEKQINSAEFQKQILVHESRETNGNHYTILNSDGFNEKELQSYIKNTWKKMNDRLAQVDAKTDFVPIDTSEFQIDEDSSTALKRVSNNVLRMFKDPVKIDFENYKKKYSSTDSLAALFRLAQIKNADLIKEHNEYI